MLEAQVQVLPQSDSKIHQVLVRQGETSTLLNLPTEVAATLVLELQKQLLGADWPEDTDRHVPELRVSSIRTGFGREGAGVLVGTDQEGVVALIVPPELCDAAIEAFRRVKELQNEMGRSN